MNFRIVSSTLSPQLLKKIKNAFKNDDTPIIIDSQNESALPSGVMMTIAQSSRIDTVIDIMNIAKNEYDSLFYLISDAIDAREGIPLGGAKRMVKIAKEIGKVLDLTENQLWILEHGCVLRDIGKLRISNEILLKKTVLTYDEWVLLKSHVHIGAHILKEYNIFPELAELIASHHECYDGDGYPEGLEGEQIPFLSRILKVLDVYCAMTSRRNYRTGVASREEALEYLLEERGKHFDPQIIDAFMKINLREIDDDL
ncbi:MAG: HD-GYP domain-containing protein [Candidatus Hydrogenedens sp.]